MNRQFPAVGLLAAGLLSAAASGAHAADTVPGNASTRATLRVTTTPTPGVIDSAGDTDWYRVRLQKGQDYTVRFGSPNYGSPASATLRDPRQRPLKESGYYSYGTSGFEFRATVTGDHFVEVEGGFDPSVGPRAYTVSVTFDCRDAATTKCAIEPGRGRDGNSTYPGEFDRFAVTLDAARRYDLTATAADEYGYCYMRVLDAAGAVLAEASEDSEQTKTIAGFRPRRSGKPYLRVGCEVAEDYGVAYRVVVTPK
jgi:hypothetical protein